MAGNSAESAQDYFDRLGEGSYTVTSGEEAEVIIIEMTRPEIDPKVIATGLAAQEEKAVEVSVDGRKIIITPDKAVEQVSAKVVDVLGSLTINEEEIVGRTLDIDGIPTEFPDLEKGETIIARIDYGKAIGVKYFRVASLESMQKMSHLNNSSFLVVGNS